jgi:hypothetical protein
MATYIVNGEEMVPLFVLPANIEGLGICIGIFLVCVAFIVWLERRWRHRLRCAKGYETCVNRILLWQFGTVLSLIVVYVLQLYCTVLPLLFLLAFLSMWYLVRVLGRQ